MPCLTKWSDPWGCPIYKKAQSCPQELHPAAHPYKAVPSLGSASREHTGDPEIVLYFDETFRKDIPRFGGRDSKAQPKDLAWHCAWVQCFRFRGGGFFPCALHWLCTAPLKPTAPTLHWELQKPNLGFRFSCCPAMLDGSTSSVTRDSMSYQSGERGSPGKSRGIEQEELILFCFLQYHLGKFYPWLEKDSKALFCCAKNSVKHSKALCDHSTIAKQDFQGTCFHHKNADSSPGGQHTSQSE